MTRNTKSTRLIFALEAVEALGVAVPSEVFAKVAHRLGAEQDVNLKRNVYRDLKDLADQGRLSVRYFRADGAEVGPDQSEAHVRVEYSLSDATMAGTRGAGLIEDSGGSFIRSSLKTMDWEFKSAATLKLEGKLSLIFEGHARTLMALQLPIDQIPAQILISRIASNDAASQYQFAKEIDMQLGGRTASIVGWDKSISRFNPGTRLGHALITVSSNGELRVKDLGSTTGTSWAEFGDEKMDLMMRDLGRPIEAKTQSISVSPLFSKFRMESITASGAKIADRSLIQFGDFRVLVILAK